MPYKDPETARLKGREYHRQWLARNPDWNERRKLLPSYRPYSRPTDAAAQAHLAIQNAIRIGHVVRPTSCSQCGTACKPEAAHADYAKPYDVRWLCRSCHRKEDQAQPKGGTTKEPRKPRVLKTPEEIRASRAAWMRAFRAKTNPGTRGMCAMCGFHKLSRLHIEKCD